MGQPRPLFRLVSVFSNKKYNIYNKSMWKMSCPSSIRHRDSNPRPLEHGSSPITTRPGLLPTGSFFYLHIFNAADSKLNLPTTGFELLISGVGSDHSLNWATTAARSISILNSSLKFWPNALIGRWMGPSVKSFVWKHSEAIGRTFWWVEKFQFLKLSENVSALLVCYNYLLTKLPRLASASEKVFALKGTRQILCQSKFLR